MKAMCRDCQFWEERPSSNYRAGYGECRFLPPSPEGGWALTKPTDWCAKFEPAVEETENEYDGPKEVESRAPRDPAREAAEDKDR